MQSEHLKIPDVKVLTPKKNGDHRGFFSEVYNKETLAEAGVHITFVQDNHAFSAEKGVVRGSVFDVAVDLRRGSPTYGKHVSVVLSAEEWNQILVPIGFAHGLMTLEPDTEVIYKVSNYYSAEHDKGLLWNDPALGIEWPVAEDEAVLSAKDKVQPRLADLPPYFHFDLEHAR